MTKNWTKSYEIYPSKMLLHNSMTKKITIIVGAVTLCWFLFHLIWPTYNNINRKTYVRHRLQPPATSQVHLLERLSLQMPDIQASWHFLQTVFFLFIWFSVKPKIQDIKFTLEPWYVHCALFDRCWTSIINHSARWLADPKTGGIPSNQKIEYNLIGTQLI